jgi:lipopolysaccharide transport system ATP-binding protein
MNPGAIVVRGLGKRYRIGRVERYPTLRDAIGRAAAIPLTWGKRLLAGNRSPAELGTVAPDLDLWAVRDVTFDVQPSEVLGIIGRNGAGKSTLLKILSRITEPTEGIAKISGRVGSLLEVGTGFHPDLTGRENIFLNGAILGMRRGDIVRRFDDIVAFAEVERFIDTPVKFFSSGMYTRLAFAVAAHLEPEVLIVDEVLAVGDAAFQRKCLGRMQDVAHEGRTVLFVSHNMDAVRRLCTRCILLSGGRLAASGDTSEVVASYLSEGASVGGPERWIDLSALSRVGTREARFVSARYTSGSPEFAGYPYPNGPLELELVVESDVDRSVDSAAVTLSSPSGTHLVNADIISLGETARLTRGRTLLRFSLEQVHLTPGLYLVGLWLAHAVGKTFDHVESAFALEVVPAPDQTLGVTPTVNGLVPCRFRFTQSRAPEA